MTETLKPINVSLLAAGNEWNVWEKVSIRRSLERLSGEFSFDLTTKPGNPFLSGNIMPGSAVQLEVNGQTLLDGYIDNLQAGVNTPIISISGRDKTGDLFDCAASVSGPFEFSNQKLEQVIAKVIKPFGIKLTVAADTGKPFARLAIQPGESAFEFLDRVCRYRAVLPVSDGIGGIVLVKPGKEKSPGKLVYGENILDGNVSIDWRERFSLYVIKGQSENSDDIDAEQASAPESRADDSQVKRYRPKLIINDAQGAALTLKERANWEKQFAKARSHSASYQVQGWHVDAEQTELWRVNTLVYVADPMRGMNREMLIVSTSYSRDDNGTVTQLDLAPPEAHDLPADKEPETEDAMEF